MADERNDRTNDTPELSEILQIRRDKLSALKQEGNDPFAITVYNRTAYAKQIVDEFERYEGTQVSIAGRIRGWRDMGKATFLDVMDSSGRIQVYVRIDGVGEECYTRFGKWDIGDIIGVEGEAFRTRRGEISIKASNLCSRCPKSGTALRIPTRATASGMSTLSSTRKCAMRLSSALKSFAKSAPIWTITASWR